MTELIKNKNYFQITCEKKSIQALENGGYQIEGYASTKDKDRGSDIVEPSAFKSALERYMTNPIVLLQHNAEKPIGIVTDAVIDSKGLYIKANITEDEDGVLSKLKNGVLRSFSIGYRVKDYEDSEVKDSEGYTIGYETVIKDLELFEISLVSIPMNPYCLLKSMESCFKSNDIKMPEEKETTVETTVEETVAETVEEGTAEECSEVEEQADVNSEIETTEESELSENDGETTSSESTASDETSTAETVAEKSASLKELSRKSLEDFVDDKFVSLKKSFEDKLAEKDSKINDLEKSLKHYQELTQKLADCIDELDTKMSNTIVNGGFTYKTEVKSKTGYSSLVKQLQS